jgi:hypothetical protein
MQPPLHEALVLAVVLLSAYCAGANCMERFVNYQTWNLIPAEAFQACNRAQEPLIQAFVVAPMSIEFALQVWLSFRVPSGVEPRVVWVMVAASGAWALSTAMLQLPIHAAFNRSSFSPELMRKLLCTDWIMKAADAVRLVATADLMNQLLSAH